jgi:structural maintenance of chromosomes protein 5
VAQAIALRPNNVDPPRAMEAISRTGGGNYIVGNTMNMVTRSQYGRRLPQNLTRDVRQARVLVGPISGFCLIPLSMGRSGIEYS